MGCDLDGAMAAGTPIRVALGASGGSCHLWEVRGCLGRKPCAGAPETA